MLLLGCDTMREGVLATLVFFILGMIFILVGANVIPEIWFFPHIIMMVGFLLLLFSPIILISTFLVTVLPKSKERMDKCNH